MDDLMQAEKIAKKMESALQVMKQLHGDKWDERAKSYRDLVNGVMSANRCGVFEAVIPIAKSMSDDGHSPVMLLAAAAEICNANKTVDRHKPL